MRKITLAMTGLALIGIQSMITAQNVNIPDPVFKGYLVGITTINTNGDSEIQVSEAQSFTGGIFISHSGVKNMTGIEAFVNLKALFCNNNQITGLDLSALTSLERVACHNNQLTSLNMRNGNNTNIVMFDTRTNPNLTCIEVDDTAYSKANWSDIDAGSVFSTNCSSIGTTEWSKKLSCEIYPNPMADNIYLELDRPYQEATIEIRNPLGELIFSRKYDVLHKHKLGLKGAGGVYLISIKTNESQFSARLLKL